MKKQNGQFVKDVEDLLEKSTVAEATEQVWDKFSAAMSRLDEGSQDILKQFFAGKDAKALSEEKRVTLKEMEAWLRQARRELVENLRSGFQVRQ